MAIKKHTGQKISALSTDSPTAADYEAGTILVHTDTGNLFVNTGTVWKRLIPENYKKSQEASPSATADTYGVPVDTEPPTGFNSMAPQSMQIVLGGTAAAQTITASITATFHDDTTQEVTKTIDGAALNTYEFTNEDFYLLVVDAKYIKKITAKSKSSIASTALTVTFNHHGAVL